MAKYLLLKQEMGEVKRRSAGEDRQKRGNAADGTSGWCNKKPVFFVITVAQNVTFAGVQKALHRNGTPLA